MAIKNRNIAVCIILTIVTCGIYGLYWDYMIIQESDYVTGNTSPMHPLLVILLGCVTCGIYWMVWFYQCGKRFDDLAAREGRAGGNNGILYLLLAIFELSFIDICLIQNELNQRATA